MTPAEEVTAAAAKLRALATAASTDDDGTPTAHWHTEPRRPHDATSSHNLYGDYITRDDGSRISWPLLNRGGSLQHPSRMRPQHAKYAAVMGPGVGLALADLLDDQADGDDEGVVNPWALAVARQILGTTP